MTPKQRRFIAEYLKDQNATKAAVRAGYSKKTANEQGSRLLAKASVRAEIEQRLGRIMDKAELTATEVITAIKRILAADPRDLVDEEGRRRRLRELPDELAKALDFEIDSRNRLVLRLSRGPHLTTAARIAKLFSNDLTVSGRLTLEDLVAGANDEPEP